MKIARAKLISISPYSQSRKIQSEKIDKEGPADFEKRAWRERAHCDSTGECFIPPMQFKKTVEISAKFLKMRIPDRGKAEYGKHLKAGILVTEPLPLKITKTEMQGEWLFVPSSGRSGGGSRVDKCFPLFSKWEGTVDFYVLDETITEVVFRKHLEEAGNFVGIGRFRPENGGFYGRFRVESLKWLNGTAA